MRYFYLLFILLISLNTVFTSIQTEKFKVLHCISGLKSNDFQKIENSLLCLHDLQLKGEGSAGYAIYQYFINRINEKEQNPQLAISYLINSAKLDHPRSLDRLAKHLETGDHIRRDLKAAYSMYLKAAELGFTKALVNLGRLLLAGEGVLQDTEAAFRLFYQASLKGDPDAQFELAHMHEKGISAPRDFVKYRQYLIRAASGGHLGAVLEISRNYLEGRYGDKNFKMAVNWLKTQEGNPRVDMMRGLLLLSQNDQVLSKEGYELINALSARKHAPATKFLADLYYAGSPHTPESPIIEEIYTRTARRQAGQLPKTSKKTSLDRSIPDTLIKYSTERKEELWPETPAVETVEAVENLIDQDKPDNALDSWITNYRPNEKIATKLKAIAVAKSKPVSNSVIEKPLKKKIVSSTKKQAIKMSQRDQNILIQSQMIEKTMDEIKITDPVSNLEQSLMLIQNRMMLASTYFSIKHNEKSYDQLHKASEQSLKLLTLLTNFVNNETAFPNILSSLSSETSIDNARNLWKNSLSKFRRGSIELFQILSQIALAYKRSGDENNAQVVSRALQKFTQNNSRGDFIGVNFNENHPLNLLSKKLTGKAFDKIYPIN